MKNNLLLIIFSLLVFFGCNKNNSITAPKVSDSPKAKLINTYFENDYHNPDLPKSVRVNSSTELNFILGNIPLSDVKCKSPQGKNKVIKKDSKFYFKASDDIGINTIIFPNVKIGKTTIDSVHLIVYKQFVILKADDIIFSDSLISPRWIKYFKYSVENNIKSGIGIIGNSLEKGNNDYYDYLKTLIKSNYFEIWNHGYNHVLGVKKEDGSLYSEFRNSGYEYQKHEIEMTQSLCKKYLNYTPKAFGAPGNAIDETTTKVIDENPDIKIWLFGKKETKKLCINRIAEIEFPYGHPIYDKFVNNYLPDEKLLTFQIHPKMWDDEKFDIFNRIIEYLETQKVTFLTPSEYYFLVSARK